MSALYIMAGVLTGVASTAISMGADGRIGALFFASLICVVIGARLEYLKNGGE